jgi:hypothetical protein
MDPPLLAIQRDETAQPSRIPAALDPLINQFRRYCHSSVPADDASALPAVRRGTQVLLRAGSVRVRRSPIGWPSVSSTTFSWQTFVFRSNEACAFVGLGLGLADDVHYL